MLLNFTVSNFRSIRDEVTLSMNGGRYKETAEGCRAIKTEFAQFPCALRAAAIYGANAAGKSSVINALEFLQKLVVKSARDEAGSHLRSLPVCRALASGEDQGSLFEINFIEDDVQYTYGIVIRPDKVEEEWLHAKTIKGRIRELYSRTWNGESYDWNFSSHFKSKKLVDAWSKSTRDNALFLSTAIMLNSEELKPVHGWLTLRLRVVTQSSHLGDIITSKHILDEKDDYSLLLEMMQSADPSIVSFSVDAKEVEENEFLSIFNDEIRSKLSDDDSFRTEYEVKIQHKLADGTGFELELEQESDGTQIIYRYAAPFIQSIKHNLVVVIDELDQSLHPLLLERFVAIFTDPDDSDTRAQIVFTTHDTALLASDVIHRDQIWFVDNVQMGGSKLIPLSDYKPRKTDRIQKAYLQGRYKAVPTARSRVLARAK